MSSFRLKLRAANRSADTTPDAFSFVDQTGVALSSTITSAPVTIAGLTAPATITVSGGTYSINSTSTFTSSSGTVVNGDVVRARLTSSGSATTAVNCVVTIGGVSDTFTATTTTADTTPNAFSFVDQTNVALSTATTSAAITVSGIDAATAISVSGGTYSVNGGSFTSSTGTVNNGDLVRARVTSSASTTTATSCTVTIGGVSDTFSATTGDGTSPVNLMPEHLTNNGYARFNAASYGNTPTFGHDATAYRITGTGKYDVNVFIVGPNYNVYEHSLGGASPSTSYSSAPNMSLVRNWGNLGSGYSVIENDDGNDDGRGGGVIYGGAYYIQVTSTTGWLLLSYGNSYTSAAMTPSLQAHFLNHTAGTHTSYGPFRMGCGEGMSRGAISVVPQWFADTYLSASGALTLCSHGTMKSGVATKPWGFSANAWVVPDFTTLTRSSVANITVAINTTALLQDDQTNPRNRSNTCKRCYLGGEIYALGGKWGGAGGSGPDPYNAGENDTFLWYAWVETAGLSTNKAGMVAAGYMVMPQAGEGAFTGDPDGLPHFWYHIPNGSPPQCSHGQIDYLHGSTGPGAARRTQVISTVANSTLVSTVTSAIPVYNAPASAETYLMSSIYSQWSEPHLFTGVRGRSAWFDSRYNTVWSTYRIDDPNWTGTASPAVNIMEIT